MTTFAEIKTADRLKHLFHPSDGAIVRDKTGYHHIPVDKASCHFLSYNELINMVHGFKNEIKQHPTTIPVISAKLETMTKKKMEKEALQRPLVRKMWHVIQRIVNLLRGRGFVTTTGYAHRLIDDFRMASRPIVQPIPRPLAKKIPTIRKSSKSLKTASNVQKTILFRDLASFQGLCRIICEITKQEVDLHCPEHREIIYEALPIVLPNACDQIIQELIKSDAFHPELFLGLLEQITLMSENHTNKFSLEELLKAYIQTSWYTQEIPLDNDILVQGIQLLISVNPNEDPTTKIIDWLTGDNKLPLSTCERLIDAYLKKKRRCSLQEQRQYYCPNLANLQNFKQRTFLQ